MGISLKGFGGGESGGSGTGASVSGISALPPQAAEVRLPAPVVGNQGPFVVDFKIWGGAGASGGHPSATNSSGGGAAEYSITLETGAQVDFYVAQGGQNSGTAVGGAGGWGWGLGGNGMNGNFGGYGAGGGGGSSAVLVNGTVVAVAGGGGGSAGYPGMNNLGAGGGATGQNGQSGGGAAGGTAGASGSKNGGTVAGTANYYAPGGGGAGAGIGGANGGSAGGLGTTSGYNGSGHGAGGRGYADTGYTGYISSTLYDGSYRTPGNSTDPLRGTAGDGISGSAQTNGTDGLILYRIGGSGVWQTVSYTGSMASILISDPGVNSDPVWTTAAGSLGTFNELTAFNQTLIANDPEGSSITYSVSSGTLPGDLTLASDGGLSGTLAGVVATETFNFTVAASDGVNSVDRAFSITVTDVQITNQVYTIPGEYSFTVPAGVTSVTAICWGGGGAGGKTGGGANGTGGAGGYTTGTFSVTPGQTLKVICGGAGVVNTTTSSGGSGGGLAGVFDTTYAVGNTKVIAAGGGGGQGAAGYSFYGGAGGGTNGQQSLSYASVAMPGSTQTNGGVISNRTVRLGTQLQGAHGSNYSNTIIGTGNPGGFGGGGDSGPSGISGAGGGGGWYGGGAGRGYWYPAAPGGSGRVDASVTGSTETGALNVPPQTGHTNYVAPAGEGGTIGTNGQNGRVVLTF